MVINPTFLAQRTRQSVNWHDAQRRVLKNYREWIRSVRIPYYRYIRGMPWMGSEIAPVKDKIRWAGQDRANDPWQAPEIQTMYSLSIPVPALRTKMRQEFERHRYVNQIQVVDTLLFQSHAEYQETLNYWKQLPHILKYFRAEEDPTSHRPKNFMNGFLEGRN
ncbi:hypothetical protein ONS96_008000 [Cadophora gregata f. sp. sojae]|nr:hypothetical protein ONS96_008000 [Cadophora gregata f. sp. sojae]